MSYDANSIQVKDFRQACRSLPYMYLGASGTDATYNAFLEILNNACDEAMMGRGNEIKIDLKDDELTCSDAAAGVPRGPNKDCEEVLIEIYTSAHSSGKFNNDNYTKVRGSFGCGSSAVCVCCKEFDVTTKRDGGEWHLLFKDGIPQEKTAKLVKKTKETGTTIRFVPDKTIFGISEDTPSFDYKRIREELLFTSYFIPNVSFILTYNGKTETFLSKNGLRDFAETQIKNPLHKNYIYGKKVFPDETEIEVFAQWTKGKEKSFLFTNGALNVDGGTPITGAKAAFTRTVNSLSGKSFDSDMIRKGLVYIINARVKNPIWQNQIKNRLLSKECQGQTQTVFTEAIKEFAKKNPEDFNKIIGLLDKEQRADAAAEKARIAVLESASNVEKNQKRKVFSSDKLKDAEYLGEKSTLLIVEGDSAASAVAQARDRQHFGLLAIKGKILNCLSNTEEAIFKNEEINLLLSAMNIVPNKYNSAKLRYGKIAICSDADSDGFHIGLLVMAAIYKLCPQFLQEDRLYWMRTPLYIVKNGKQETYYFTDDEMNVARPSLKGEVQRAKGIGALSAEQVHNSMFNPKYQRLELLHPSEEAIILLQQLMGEDVSYRKDFIFSHVDFSKISE